MIARLRGKEGGADVTVTQGDFSQVRVGGSFTLVYLVFNTIMNLTTQERQQACFRNAAEHLDIGGVFVVEVMIPALRLLPPGQTAHVFDISDDHIGIDEYDVSNQGLISHHFHLEPGQEPNRASVPFRYVWPAELDLMAEMAGMRLRHRWENWDRDPFTSDSPGHVSVWERMS